MKPIRNKIVDYSHGDIVCPALITRVNEDWTAALTVFPPNEPPFTVKAANQGTGPGLWRWADDED